MWLGLAYSKLEYHGCSSYYVTHPVEGDIMQNPVVIINNHLLPQYDAKQTTLGCCSFIIVFINTLVVHDIVNKSTLGQFSYNICLILNRGFLKVFLYFRTFKQNC